MQLTNIEYGSLASSALLNNNFIYLDEKIAETNTNLNSSISAILSNIETINTRLTQVAENAINSHSNLELSINDFKTKSLATFNKITMLPNWSAITSILDLSSFTASANGYLLLIPKNNASGKIKVNNFEFTLKQITNSYDNSSELLVVPIKKDDKVSCTVQMSFAYFLPATSILINEL